MLIIYNSSGKMHAAGEAAGIGNEARYIDKAPAVSRLELRFFTVSEAYSLVSALVMRARASSNSS